MRDQFKKAINKIKSGEQTIHLMPVYGFNFQLGRLKPYTIWAASPSSEINLSICSDSLTLIKILGK